MFGLTEIQQELLLEILGKVSLNDIEKIVEERGEKFEDFAQIYNIIKHGGK